MILPAALLLTSLALARELVGFRDPRHTTLEAQWVRAVQLQRRDTPPTPRELRWLVGELRREELWLQVNQPENAGGYASYPEQVVYAIVAAGDAAIMPLVALLRSRDEPPSAYTHAARGLALLGGGTVSAAPALSARLAHPDFDVVSACATALHANPADKAAYKDELHAAIVRAGAALQQPVPPTGAPGR